MAGIHHVQDGLDYQQDHELLAEFLVEEGNGRTLYSICHKCRLRKGTSFWSDIIRSYTVYWWKSDRFTTYAKAPPCKRPK